MKFKKDRESEVERTDMRTRKSLAQMKSKQKEPRTCDLEGIKELQEVPQIESKVKASYWEMEGTKVGNKCQELLSNKAQTLL